MTSLSFLALRSPYGVPTRDVARLTRPIHYLLENGALPLSPATVEALREYSSSLPTGVGEGKVWKRRVRGAWWLGRYGAAYPDDHQYAGSVPLGWWPIYVEGRPPAFPRDIRVPPPPMRGRPVTYTPEGKPA